MKEETKLNIAVIILGLIITFLLCSNYYYFNQYKLLKQKHEYENETLKKQIIEANTKIEELNNILDNKDSMCVWYYKPNLKKELK
ncbi:MAG: hypothetical protein ACFFKA_19870 [Candidatus Thorarchaeota archaeon]